MRANFTLTDHERQVNAAQQAGARTISVLMPCCERPLTLTAPADESAWLDFRMCPHCGTVWETITRRQQVRFDNPDLGIHIRPGKDAP